MPVKDVSHLSAACWMLAGVGIVAALAAAVELLPLPLKLHTYTMASRPS
jgi:hypothetical protein